MECPKSFAYMKAKGIKTRTHVLSFEFACSLISIVFPPGSSDCILCSPYLNHQQYSGGKILNKIHEQKYSRIFQDKLSHKPHNMIRNFGVFANYFPLYVMTPLYHFLYKYKNTSKNNFIVIVIVILINLFYLQIMIYDLINPYDVT